MYEDESCDCWSIDRWTRSLWECFISSLFLTIDYNVITCRIIDNMNEEISTSNVYWLWNLRCVSQDRCRFIYAYRSKTELMLYSFVSSTIVHPTLIYNILFWNKQYRCWHRLFEYSLLVWHLSHLDWENFESKIRS